MNFQFFPSSSLSYVSYSPTSCFYYVKKRGKCKEVKHLRRFLPGVAIEVVEGTDCKVPHYVAVVQDFVEGAHVEIGLVVGPNLNVDQD